MPDMPSAFYIPAFGALATVIGVLWRDNLVLRALLVELTKTTALAIDKAAEGVRVNNAELARGRDEITRYIQSLAKPPRDSEGGERRPRTPR